MVATHADLLKAAKKPAPAGFFVHRTLPLPCKGSTGGRGWGDPAAAGYNAKKPPNQRKGGLDVVLAAICYLDLPWDDFPCPACPPCFWLEVEERLEEPSCS